MAQSTFLFDFLRMHMEVRLSVYEFVLQDTTLTIGWLKMSLLPLASTCWQIRHEALPILFQHYPFSFSFLSDFLDWTSRGPAHLVRQVRVIRINEMTSNMYPRWYGRPPHICLGSTETGEFTASWWINKLQEKRIKRYTLHDGGLSGGNLDLSPSKIGALWTAFLAMPKTRQLWLDLLIDPLDFLAEGGSFNGDLASALEKEIVLEMVAAAFPDMKILTVTLNLHSLDFLRDMPKLKYLHINGPTTSTPSDTLDILLSLKYLDSLTVRSERPSQETYSYLDIAQRLKHCSITPQVIEKMNPLGRLEVYVNNRLPPFYSGNEMIKALEAHKNSLQVLLFISEDEACSIDFCMQLLRFIKSSRLRRLLVLLCVPESIRKQSVVFGAFLPDTSSRGLSRLEDFGPHTVVAHGSPHTVLNLKRLHMEAGEELDQRAKWKQEKKMFRVVKSRLWTDEEDFFIIHSQKTNFG
ncbi:hypothetical protein B0J14DRAFT_635776 [Halenospora varia]|nr:hypothetical protein B0J14DRAFT_635776 [Halenospora varia]